MRTLLARLWADDQGAVVTPEIVLVSSVGVLGTVPALVAMRNSNQSALATLGNQIQAVQSQYAYSPYTLQGPGGAPIASVSGRSTPW